VQHLINRKDGKDSVKRGGEPCVEGFKLQESFEGFFFFFLYSFFLA